MLELTQIQSFYPENIRPYKRYLLREYLQYKILELIFSSKYAGKLSFMGGTCIHIIHSNPRFSDNLDFDSLDISQEDFQALSISIKRDLELEGYVIELKTTYRGAFRAQMRFKDILPNSGLSAHREEKLLIQIDAEPQHFNYNPEKVILNKFDVFSRINAVPIDILLAQKCYCIINRKRSMGRDFYDVIFLMGKTEVNMDYLESKMDIGNMEDLRSRLLFKCKELDFKQLVRDVEPFTISKKDATKILMFPEYIRGM